MAAQQNDGHIETEFGTMPSDWALSSIGDLGKVVTGSTPSTKHPEYYGGQYKFISPSDLNGSRYLRTSEKSLTREGLSVSRILPSKSVLVSCIGYIGKTGLTADTESATNQQINAIICSDKNDPEFVYHLVTSLAPFIAGRARKTTVPIINKGVFESLPIPLPPLPEQRRIAAVLNAIQDAIAAQEDVIAAARQFKRSLMQRLFTYGPGSEPAETKETEIGEIPAHWEVTELAALCAGDGGAIQTGPFGSQLHAADYVEHGIPTVMPQDMVEGRVSIPNIARIADADHERLAKYHLRVGDVVYARRGDIGRRALVTDDEDGWLCGTGSLFIRPSSPAINSTFLFHFLGKSEVIDYRQNRRRRRPQECAESPVQIHAAPAHDRADSPAVG
ncbi:MAG: restriction endonuclease subunit S [Anaerolineales bacterium]|nr:restriction endonuclease subunit S [Anaerolineales bacterium]